MNKKFAKWLAVVLFAVLCAGIVACSTTKVKVSFDAAGGTAVQEQTIDKGSFAQEPGTPEKEGYTFDGWMLDEGKFVFASTPVEEDITLKAAWKANTDTKYYLTIKVDGDDKTSEYAEAFGLLGTAGKFYLTGTTDTQADVSALAQEKMPEGKELLTSSVMTGKIAGDESLTLSIEYKTLEYSVSFDTGSEQAVAPQIVKHGDLAADPQFVKAGYTVSWQADGKDFSFDTPIKQNTELKLVLTPRTDTKYFVTVKVNGEDKTQEYAEAFSALQENGKYYLTGTTDTTADIAQTAESATPEGYHVSDESVLSGVIVGDGSLVLTVDYAVNTYNIVFTAGGGSGEMAEQVFSYGETKALEANAFTKMFYTFDGWKCGKVTYTDGQEIINLTKENGARLEFVAQWKQDELLVAESADEVIPFSDAKSSADNASAFRFKVGNTSSTAAYKSAVLDQLQNNMTLSMTVKIQLMSGDWSTFITDFKLQFYALGGKSVIASFASGYVGDNGKTLANNQEPRLTLDANATAKIAEAGGFEVSFYSTKEFPWRNEQLCIKALSLKKSLPETEVKDGFDDTNMFSFGYAGQAPKWCEYENKDATGANNHVLNLQGSQATNDTYFEISGKLFEALRKGDQFALDVYIYNESDDIYDYNAGTFKDYAIEIYALNDAGEYTSPLATFGGKEYKLIPWRWVTLQLTVEQTETVAQAGGIAIRLRMPSDYENLSYQLYVDNLSLQFGNETIAIETTAETYEADIAAEVTGRFYGLCAAWAENITEEDGTYKATVVLSKDGYFDRKIEIVYTVAE